MTMDIEERLRAASGRLPRAEPGRDMAEAAARDGLLDVAYAEVDSPLGPLIAAATPRGLARLAYADDGRDAALEDLARRISPRVLESPTRLDGVRRELDEYFGGRRREFEIPLDLRLARGFGARVLSCTARVPFGEVTTYAQVAEAAGSPRGSRAAGNALGANPIPIVVPCHRVLRSGGGLGGYTGGLHRKRALLAVEGR
jgi:methylated-DNA-[protein]-cysteine S-methyltransferase